MSFSNNDVVEIEKESFVNITGTCSMYAFFLILCNIVIQTSIEDSMIEIKSL